MKNESVRDCTKLTDSKRTFYFKVVGKYAERHKLAWEIANLKSLKICLFHHKEF